MQLLEGVLKVVRPILTRLDLQQHHATHPRIGIIDHISCSPLRPLTDMQPSAQLAQKIGMRLLKLLKESKV